MSREVEHDNPKELQIGARLLDGLLWLPENPIGLIIFAHGSGSSRFSPRNTFVASEFRRGGFATLLFDLLTPDEAKIRSNVFDIPLLAGRVGETIAEARANPALSELPIGLFGASTGAAAALVAAAEHPDEVASVVSRGGRPDLATSHLSKVRCPTLLIVGGSDSEVLELNREALAQLTCVKGLRIVPGATHLFEEPGALLEVVEQALFWFRAHMGAAGVESF